MRQEAYGYCRQKVISMRDVLKEVAERIRELREIEGKTAEQMAAVVGLSPEEYREMETGTRDFSFTFLYKLANACRVEMADLLKGQSPSLSSYEVTRRGEGLPIARRKGFSYLGQAPLFRHKIAEPFLVKIPCTPNAETQEIPLSTHKGQEFDIVLKGRLKYRLGNHEEYLEAGDTIYYDSSTPHGMVAVDGEDAEMYAVVMNPEATKSEDYDKLEPVPVKQVSIQRPHREEVASKFVHVELNAQGIPSAIAFRNEDRFNFAFDIVDALAEKSPDKLAMLHLSREKTERRFSFSDISRYSSQAANYFESLGIRKGDRVMLVLKRHYQFWFAILGLHKMGAIAIPATNLLVAHDFEYRFQAAGVRAIVCTSDGDVAEHVDAAAKTCPELEIKMLAGGSREGWHDFDKESAACSDVYQRRDDSACGDDAMVMFFTSGTTGYPKIATHSHKYPLGHYITAKYWHNVNPDGLHFTISDTGWGKALWGKLYGQWLCEAGIFTYDFDKFDAHDLMPLFAKYHITTFCAPPTMYRFFIKEDLSKYDLSSIEYATVAGEALNPEVYQQFYNATGVRLMEGFGQTETTLVCYNPIGTLPKPGSMGKPSPLYDVQILMPDGTPAKSGETGEIVICTKKGTPCGLFKGYYRGEDKTREAWHDGYYHTGDTAWCDEDGYFWYVGRVDDLIKSSGYRIGPFEIESVIMELPYVLECAVTAAPDPIRGQVVKATVVLVKDTEPTEALKKDIQQYVKVHTAPYKYPRIVEFRESLPKTISGKIRRTELR